MLSFGLVSVFSVLFFGNSGIIRLEKEYADIQFLFALLAVTAIPLSHYALFRTPWGLRMRGSGTSADVLYFRGINPDYYRYTSMILSGLLCGFAGASLSFSIEAFVPNISAGRGWIALVAVYMGYKKPLGVILSCLLFASAESLSGWMQGMIEIPATIILAIPYIITLSVLTGVSIYRSSRAE